MTRTESINLFLASSIKLKDWNHLNVSDFPTLNMLIKANVFQYGNNNSISSRDAKILHLPFSTKSTKKYTGQIWWTSHYQLTVIIARCNRVLRTMIHTSTVGRVWTPAYLKENCTCVTSDQLRTENADLTMRTDASSQTHTDYKTTEVYLFLRHSSVPPHLD